MRGGRKRVPYASAADDIPCVSHRAGDNAEHAFASRCRSLAVDYNLATICKSLVPCKVVVILNHGGFLQPNRCGDPLVDDVVIG